MPRPIRKAVFPVAGLGTRFLPATKVMPKEMLVVVDKPLIQWAVEEAASAGCVDFILVTSRGKSMQVDHFDHHEELVQVLAQRGKTAELQAVESILPPEGRVISTRQSRALGLGHAVWCAKRIVGDEPFAVILPDDMVLADTPCLKQMVGAYNRVGGNVVGVMNVPREQTRRYGILDVAKDDKREGALVAIKGLVEKPAPEKAPSTLSIIGRYILQPEIFAHLEKGESGAGGEIQLTDAMARMIGQGPFHGYRFRGTRYDCGDKAGYIAANLAFALERPDLAPAVRAHAKRLFGAG
ncbi:MAG TPA: UTP--glucose-1-phosphate uridylyltransferase GalU [Alphaproteobacteria bacterium]